MSCFSITNLYHPISSQGPGAIKYGSRFGSLSLNPVSPPFPLGAYVCHFMNRDCLIPCTYWNLKFNWKIYVISYICSLFLCYIISVLEIITGYNFKKSPFSFKNILVLAYLILKYAIRLSFEYIF
jgi:hypothetical protein